MTWHKQRAEQRAEVSLGTVGTAGRVLGNEPPQRPAYRCPICGGASEAEGGLCIHCQMWEQLCAAGYGQF